MRAASGRRKRGGSLDSFDSMASRYLVAYGKLVVPERMAVVEMEEGAG